MTLTRCAVPTWNISNQYSEQQAHVTEADIVSPETVRFLMHFTILDRLLFLKMTII